MARPRNSRSPSPAGRRRHDDLRHRCGHRRRSRSPEEVRRHYGDEDYPSRSNKNEQRRHRDRDRGGDSYRRRERSIERRRNDEYRGSRRDERGSRDRRRSRDRPRSPENRRPGSREADRNHCGTRDDTRARETARREGTADFGPRRGDESRPRGQDSSDRKSSKDNEPAKSTQTHAQSEAEKKAERLRKIQAMKEKRAMKEAQESTMTPGSTRKLLAEMDQKASGVLSPTVLELPDSTPSGAASPAPYGGKFDPKAIAKSSKANRAQSPSKLGDVKLGDVKMDLQAPKARPVKASSLLQNRGMSGFGFNKTATKLGGDAEKKRKIDLDDEETSKRKLVKLPDAALEADNDVPYAQDDDQDDDQEIQGDNEEEIAAAARAAHERREERILQQSMAAKTEGDGPGSEQPEPVTEANGSVETEAMDVDAEDVDPLDAFMAGLDDSGARGKSFNKASGPQPQTEPEAYFSDDDFGSKTENADASSILALASAKNKKSKKDIPSIDYSKLQLNPVRNKFWVEPLELKDMTEDEIVELRMELDGIKVSGKDVPKPVQKWSQCGLTRPMLDAIDSLGHEKPTPIQMQALPVIMSGRDVVGVAKTGSGKTMAFLLPMFRHIKDQEPVGDNDGPIGLIMTPTRELVVQIHRDCKPFLKVLGLRAVAAYGGAPIKDQIAELKRGAEIVVATPGRMIDLLAANQGRVTNLKRATYLVLDEADRMFDMGFEPQVMKIFANVRPDRQTILFSATMPRIIDALTKKVLRSPVEITVGGRSVVAPEITQVVETRDEKDKFNRLLELLGELYMDDDDVRALIFVERQKKADDVLRELLRRGYGCMSIHGAKDQDDRDSTISDFKAGICPILVATSIAARGLDVKQLKLVVNYDAPNHLEDYVHRAGRTGRAGKTGTAVTFVTEEQDSCAPGICKALEQSGQPVPEWLNDMRKAWKEKVRAGKAKDTSGFGGKGLEKLDKDREAARQRERKTHKGEGEEEEGETDNKKTTDDEKTKKAMSAIQGAASAVVARDAAKEVAASATTTGEAKNTSPLPPSAPSGKSGALETASSRIAEINKRLQQSGHLRAGQPIEHNKGPDAGAFHATLEINDFPQKARWAVTNRTNVAKILEATGTSITTKGNFYAEGKEPPPGAEPKLYILIEGDTEVVVSNALSELTRLLREATMAVADAPTRAPTGRYTVT